MNKQNIHKMHVQIYPTKAVHGDKVTTYDNLNIGTLRLEEYRDKFGLAAMKAENYTYLVTDTRTSIS